MSTVVDIISAIIRKSKYTCIYLSQSYHDRRGFIVTQTPLPQTHIDFWRLVYDHDVTAIIAVDVMGDDEVSQCPIIK